MEWAEAHLSPKKQEAMQMFKNALVKVMDRTGVASGQILVNSAPLL